MKKILQDKPIIVNEQNIVEMRKTYNREQQVECVCSKCKKTFTRSLRFIEFPFLCRTCSIEKTAIKKYGSVENMQKINLEHGKQTSIKKYGMEHFTNRDKCRETKKEKYGKEYYTNRDKAKKTLLEKYNVDNPSKIEGVPDKVRKTKLERYGSASYNNSDLAKNTCLTRYGIENPGCLNGYYDYNGIKFDSSWELLFWIYCIDHCLPIKRADITYKYIYNNKEHIYHPDFDVDGKIFEIKGDQFFKDDGTMQNPYDHSMDGLYEAKHQCGLANNVIFLTKIDMDEIIDYVDTTYGKNYIFNFRINKND